MSDESHNRELLLAGVYGEVNVVTRCEMCVVVYIIGRRSCRVNG